MEKPPKKLLDQVRDAIRLKHYSLRTEKTYRAWIKRYTLRVFHDKRHPKDMGVDEIQTFITHIATQRMIGRLMSFMLSSLSTKPCGPC